MQEVKLRVGRNDLLKIIVWFYLTMTGQLVAVGNQARVVFNTVPPLERDILYNFIGAVLDQTQVKQRVLGIIESELTFHESV